MKRFLIFCLSITALFFTMSVNGQAPSQRKGKLAQRPDKTSDFLKTQWWLGFYAGTNVTEAVPGERYSGVVALNYDASQNEKSYDAFSLPGVHAGINLTFYHRGFSFIFAPNYRTERFAYTNTYLWYSEENAMNSLELNYEQEHSVQFLDIPAMLRYDILYGPFRPFVQAGAYYRHLLGASKSITISGVDFASGGSGPFENEAVTVGAKDLFVSSSAGIIGGIGCTYDKWNVRFILDVSYRMGLSNLTNAGNRYNENPLTGIGDAMDDLKLNSISVNLGCVFPLRFISNNLKAVE